MDHDNMKKYAADIARCIENTKFSDEQNVAMPGDLAIQKILRILKGVKENKNKMMIVGNGGSSSIASHLSQDFTKMGKVRTQCFTDAALLTMLTNDFSHEAGFEQAIAMHGGSGDALIAISSSGNSKNILNAVTHAKKLGCVVITLSGFQPDNKLRGLGHVNVYTPSPSYGIVEIAHTTVLHSILDHIVENPL